jgi:hypothetical protein
MFLDANNYPSSFLVPMIASISFYFLKKKEGILAH